MLQIRFQIIIKNFSSIFVGSPQHAKGSGQGGVLLLQAYVEEGAQYEQCFILTLCNTNNTSLIQNNHQIIFTFGCSTSRLLFFAEFFAEFFAVFSPCFQITRSFYNERHGGPVKIWFKAFSHLCREEPAFFSSQDIFITCPRSLPCIFTKS